MRDYRNFQGPKGRVPGALELTDWSPDSFLAVEPGAQRHFARSPEPSIFKFALILNHCLFVFVCAHRETESEKRTVHNTSIRGYLSLQ